MPASDTQDPLASRDTLDLQDYRPNLLHFALIVAGFLGKLSPLLLIPTWFALAVIACWPWQDLRFVIAVSSLAFICADGVSLALLPQAGRSFGPVTPPLLALAIVRTGVTLGIGLLWKTKVGLLFALGINLALLLASIYATWVEPFRVGVTRVSLRSPKLNGHSPIRLLHITDIHVERITARERELLRLIDELAPDLIVLTGDYLILGAVDDAVAQSESHSLLAGLCEIADSQCPIYAVTGSPPVDHPDIVPAIFEDLPINWLIDEVENVQINGHALRLAGLRCTEKRSLDASNLQHLLDGGSTDRFTLLLYHSPDLMPEAVELGVDLYLCGHTHGGQIRLPIFGAVFTSSDFGKRYEMGRYEEKGTTLYVGRGLGVEGLGAPRARFFSPPEIVLWTLSS